MLYCYYNMLFLNLFKGERPVLKIIYFTTVQFQKYI
uniref:Uncharacterized protein n=1 Tax=Anguilla anguilla TaxID=7936 RepID=A0A0E9W800_ANGAN